MPTNFRPRIPAGKALKRDVHTSELYYLQKYYIKWRLYEFYKLLSSISVAISFRNMTTAMHFQGIHYLGLVNRSHEVQVACQSRTQFS